jgi:hypothetical protein
MLLEVFIEQWQDQLELNTRGLLPCNGTRFSEKLEKDRKIRRGVQEIMRDLSHIKT